MRRLFWVWLIFLLAACGDRSALPDAGRVTGTAAPPAGEVAAGGATALVLEGVQALGDNYYEELRPEEVFRDAWDGAAAALATAGITAVPTAPAFATDLATAARQHREAFPRLEELARGRLDATQLARGALHALAVRRGDPHTSYRPRELVERDAATRQGEAAVQIGLGVSRTSPPLVVRVPPGSPAERGGLQLGQAILAVNGTPVAHGADVPALVDVRAGVANTFTVRDGDGRRRDLTVLPAPYTRPLEEHRVLEGRVGVLRFDGFPDSDAFLMRLREVFAAFERQGVTGWVLDLRENGGGVLERVMAVTSLFVERGVLLEERRRGTAFQTLMADGRALPVQRPLMVLAGPGSFSGGEILAAVLQAHGRATVIGEPTGGGFGSATVATLSDGSALNVTATEVLVGPERRRYNRVGLAPDRLVPRTHADVVAGRDPQLAAALEALAGR